MTRTTMTIATTMPMIFVVLPDGVVTGVSVLEIGADVVVPVALVAASS